MTITIPIILTVIPSLLCQEVHRVTLTFHRIRSIQQIRLLNEVFSHPVEVTSLFRATQFVDMAK